MRAWLALLGIAIVGAIALGVIVIVATTSEQAVVLDLGVGDCFDHDLDDGASELGAVSVVDCGEPHEAEVVALGEFDPDGDVPRLPDDELFAAADQRCLVALTGRPALLDRFGVLPVVADERSWASFNGLYVCVAIPYGGGTTTGSALD